MTGRTTGSTCAREIAVRRGKPALRALTEVLRWEGEARLCCLRRGVARLRDSPTPSPIVRGVCRTSGPTLPDGGAMRIARQSIQMGLGLSGVAMLLAAFGLIAPAVGAVLQEIIDVAVIINALRARRPGAPSVKQRTRETRGEASGPPSPATV